MRAHAPKIVLLLLFLGAAVALRFTGIGDLLTLENLRRNGDMLLARVHADRSLSLLIYVAAYTLVVAFSLPGGAVMTIAGGFLFGAATAVPCIVVGATAGAVLAFLFARYVVGDRLQQTYSAQLERFNRDMAKNGTRYLLTLRLIPVFPFFMVNFLAGLTRAPLRSFAWTTAAGIIPGTAVYAFAGQQLETVHTIVDILSAKVLLAFGLLALFTLVPVVRERLKKKP